MGSFLLAILLAISGISLGLSNDTGCTETCTFLSHVLGEKVIFPGMSNYTQFSQTYYSALEGELAPSCVVLPSSAEDVSLLVKKLSSVNLARDGWEHPSCPFAIKGGGHAPASGAANINKGITLSLSSLNQASLSVDKTIISLGGGAQWGSAYDVLTPLGLSVPGGRDSEVGVSGFVTGGGISFFTPRTGFSCDNVENFQVVLADGSIVDANANTNPGLWKALRGGSNNFGVVVRTDMRAFAQSDYLGGSITFPMSSIDHQIEAFANLASSEDFDPYVSVIMTCFWSSEYGFLISNNLAHTSSNSSLVNPPASIQPFLEIQPQIDSTMRISNVSDFVSEISGSSTSLNSLRNLFATTTFQANAEFMKDVFSSWNNTMVNLTKVPSLASSGLTFEPIPTAITNKSQALGGNSLGLTPEDGNLVLIQLSLTWTSASDDDTLVSATRILIDQIDTAGKSQGYHNSWKYLNYAASYQNVIAGYGVNSAAHLEMTSLEYDPLRFFQVVVPGGFKLSI